MKVKLLAYTPEPEKVIAIAARICYSSKADIETIAEGFTEEEISKFIEQLISTNHASCLEHSSFSFGIEGISRACYDKDTEILTRQGWKLFKDIQNDETVATLNPITKEVEFQQITEKIQYRYDGVMHHYQGVSVDLCVTPNHRLYIKKHDVRVPVDYQLVRSEDITFNQFRMLREFRYDPEVSDTVIVHGFSYDRLNNAGKTYTVDIPDITYSKYDFCKLLAIYLSEGSVQPCGPSSYCVSIAQYNYGKNSKTRQEIINTIRQLGHTPTVGKQNIRFKTQQLGKLLHSLGHAEQKRIPYDIFSFFNHEYAKLFIDTYLHYDGNINYKNRDQMSLYTTSPYLRDQLQILCDMAGYTTNIHIDDRRGQWHPSPTGQLIQHNHVCYNISLSSQKNHTPFIRKSRTFFEELYSGMVYCVEVPNHIVFVRRNFKDVWCGNCSHELVRHRIGIAISQRSQRYCSEGEAEFICPNIIADGNEQVDEIFWSSVANSLGDYKDLLREEIPKEAARYVLPNATATRMIVTMNARELRHFFALRCCFRALPEMRDLACAMLAEVKKVAPTLFKNAGASCEQLGYCPEGKRSCGLKPTLEKLKEGYRLAKNLERNSNG